MKRGFHDIMVVLTYFFLLANYASVIQHLAMNTWIVNKEINNKD